jgi:predicted amidohydrolase YtcJ
MSDELLFSGGRIVTLDPRWPAPEAVLVRHGRIAAIGSLSEVRAERRPGCELMDLAGSTLLPGFYDAHQHQVYAGLAAQAVDARVGSVDELVTRVAARAAKQPDGSWIEGGGFNLATEPGTGSLSRAEMDRAAPCHPVLITHSNGHVMVLNGRALRAAGIGPDTPDPPGGQIDRGPDGREPTGVLRESAMERVRSVVTPPGEQQLEAAILSQAEVNLRYGITSVWEPSVEPDHVSAYQSLLAASRLPIRVTMAQKRVLRSGEMVAPPRPWRGDWLSLVAIKLFQDGAIPARTAAVSQPYEGSTDARGLLRWPQATLNEFVDEAHRCGLAVSIHAIGDVAITSALDAIDAAVAADPRPHRHRIEHCGLPIGDLVDRLAASGVTPVLQPPFLHFMGEQYRRELGPERVDRLYPTKTLLSHCPIVAGSSDGPVVPDVNPLFGMRLAVTRRSDRDETLGPGETVSPTQALYMYTLGAAGAAGEEHHKGSISPGKFADLAVLDADPTALPAEELDDIGVALVVVNGRVAFAR